MWLSPLMLIYPVLLFQICIICIFVVHQHIIIYVTRIRGEVEVFCSRRMLLTYVLVAESKMNIQGVTWCLFNIQEDNFWDYFVLTCTLICFVFHTFRMFSKYIAFKVGTYPNVTIFYEGTYFFENKTIRCYTCSWIVLFFTSELFGRRHWKSLHRETFFIISF